MSSDRCPVCDDISDHGPGEVACLRRAQVRRDDDLLTRCLAAEAARDEATRRLAVVEEAVRSARDLLNSDAGGGWAANVASAVVVLNNAMENPK